MKRKKQLAPLSREHHQSLVLAKKCIDISRSNDMALISAQCKQIVQNFDEIWESHFTIEEQVLFKLASSYSDQLQRLCDDLVSQHQLLREIKQQMQQDNYSSLEKFGMILKTHTRTEERELFPQVERFFNQDELSELYRSLEKRRVKKNG
jgi:hemerythrin-like domain-containing protein